MRRRLKIAIDAQLLPAVGNGGIESVLIGLVSALGRLDGDEEYLIVGHPQDPEWLRPYLGRNQNIVSAAQPAAVASGKADLFPVIRRMLRPLRAAARQLWNTASPPQPAQSQWLPVPISGGFHESLGCDVLHIPHQGFVVCAMPTIYNPHDLQHLHYPQFFSPATIARRETVYRAGCQFSRTVVVASDWIKNDICKHYGTHHEKLQVIPWAPPTAAHAEPSEETLAAVKRTYSLPCDFALYPAMTWEHKNHLRLLEAVGLLRERRGITVHLVCTGHKNEFWPRIEQRLSELGLTEQVKFLGIVPGDDLRALYHSSQFVVVPTLFEAASGPVFEAWQEGAPVTCSTVTSLPQQVGDAALLFDPLSVDAIAQALEKMATDHDFRAAMRKAGRQRLAAFSWERTAKAYRAVYRRAAGFALSAEDRDLLDWDWMSQRTPKDLSAKCQNN